MSYLKFLPLEGDPAVNYHATRRVEIVDNSSRDLTRGIGYIAASSEVAQANPQRFDIFLMNLMQAGPGETTNFASWLISMIANEVGYHDLAASRVDALVMRVSEGTKSIEDYLAERKAIAEATDLSCYDALTGYLLSPRSRFTAPETILEDIDQTFGYEMLGITPDHGANAFRTRALFPPKSQASAEVLTTVFEVGILDENGNFTTICEAE